MLPSHLSRDEVRALVRAGIILGGGTLLLQRTDLGVYPDWVEHLARERGWSLRRQGDFVFQPASLSWRGEPSATLLCWHSVPDGIPVRTPLAEALQDPIDTSSTEDDRITQFSE